MIHSWTNESNSDRVRIQPIDGPNEKYYIIAVFTLAPHPKRLTPRTARSQPYLLIQSSLARLTTPIKPNQPPPNPTLL